MTHTHREEALCFSFLTSHVTCLHFSWHKNNFLNPRWSDSTDKCRKESKNWLRRPVQSWPAPWIQPGGLDGEGRELNWLQTCTSSPVWGSESGSVLPILPQNEKELSRGLFILTVPRPPKFSTQWTRNVFINVFINLFIGEAKHPLQYLSRWWYSGFSHWLPLVKY